MLKRKVTLVVVPDTHGDLKQLRLPVYAVYVVALALALLTISGLWAVARYFDNKVSQTELERLRGENQQLAQQFQQLRTEIAEVDDRYQGLVQKEVRIRSLFDLPPIDPQERELGVGGPTPVGQASASPTEQVAYVTEQTVDHLLRLSSFELEQFAGIATTLESVKDRLDHSPSIWPTTGWTSRGFGVKSDPFTGYERMHAGVDIANYRGTPVVATASGKVVRVELDAKLGRLITIDHGYGLRTRYGHLRDTRVNVGQLVKRGDIIGTMGSSGYSTGPHLHYEVLRDGRCVDPMKYILNEM